MLTFNLREDILLGKYARFYKHRLTDEQFLKLLRVTSISVSCNFLVPFLDVALHFPKLKRLTLEPSPFATTHAAGFRRGSDRHVQLI